MYTFVKAIVYLALFVVAIGAGSFFWWVSMFGKSAVHEILAGVYLLVGVACVAGIGVMAAIDHMADRMAQRLPKPRPKTAD